ncbi:MAG: hypothetical protein TREMPRED_000628, partial [Tremellales sp. Tagirdzhanova-0007]
MASDPTKQGLFSSLSLGRASRSPKPPPSETLTHPLLGASSSSLNLAADNAEAGPSLPANGRHSSWSPKLAASEALSKLPYKARQRHAGGAASISSSNSFMVPAPSLTTLTASTVSPTATGIPVSPTTYRSTSTSFPLPPSVSDAPTSPPFAVPSLAAIPGSSSATTKLQLQSLKAAAQRIGLGNGTMGMSMIDAIYDKSQGSRSHSGD